MADPLEEMYQAYKDPVFHFKTKYKGPTKIINVIPIIASFMD